MVCLCDAFDDFFAIDFYAVLDFGIAKLEPVVLVPELVGVIVPDRCHDQGASGVIRIHRQDLKQHTCISSGLTGTAWSDMYDSIQVQ